MNTARYRQNRRGLTERTERMFERWSTVIVLMLGAAWAYSIREAWAAGDKVNAVFPATAAVVGVFDRLSALAPSASAVAPEKVVGVDPRAETGRFAEMTGESGKLRARIAPGDAPGIVKAAITIAGAIRPLLVDFHFITPRPATDKRKGRIGLYYLGNWPNTEPGKKGADYSPPSGFIEVTQMNQVTLLSEHFKLRDFLTKDQRTVWPKYLVVNLKLIDKLELVLEELRAQGIDPAGAKVMSGFRTPQYNAGGGDPRGRASLSRHMYGDAADVYIDNTGNGSMDDLNGDGRVDIRDAQVIAKAAERVERAHPSLVGGIGVYAGTSAHGPFVHIDTRGYSARW